MRRAIAIADRSALPLMKLIAAVNVLLFLSFLIVATLVSSRVRSAEMPVCTGSDLLTELQKEDPAKYAEVEKEAAATPNGQGLLWKLQKEGQAPSYLFGTMHVTDPRVTTLPPAAQTAFDAAGAVVIETTDVLDQAKMMAALAKKPELMMFTDGTTLASLLSPQDKAAVDKAFSERGIPPASVARMKPWMLAAMVALPACELARKAAGAPVLDVKLAEDAKAQGKKLKGLETAADQLEAMASLPMDFHVKGLVDTLKLGDKIDDVIETMIEVYRSGQTGIFWPLFRAVLPQGEDDKSGYADFEETMVNARNKIMAENALPILADGSTFIAVGAMHLAGPKGLIEQFRKDGYTVTQVD